MEWFRIIKALVKSASEKFGHEFKRLFTTHRAVTHASPQASIPEPLPEDPTLLEILPAEIRRHVLFTLEYKELKALVHASPIYHQQYLLDQQRILCECLEATLGGIIVDAYAAYQSYLIDFLDTRSPESVTNFLESYKDSRSSMYQNSSLKKLFTMDEIISMISFHFSIVIPLIRSYTGWALSNLAKETKMDPTESVS